jgi:hypothetical protein
VREIASWVTTAIPEGICCVVMVGAIPVGICQGPSMARAIPMGICQGRVGAIPEGICREREGGWLRLWRAADDRA